jgi:hypothetical protein
MDDLKHIIWQRFPLYYCMDRYIVQVVCYPPLYGMRNYFQGTKLKEACRIASFYLLVHLVLNTNENFGAIS